MGKKTWTPEQKLAIVLEVLKEKRHIGETASEHGVHPTQIHRWKKELLDNADRVFAASKAEKAVIKAQREQEEIIEHLHAQVGRLTTQLEWLKKNLEVDIPTKDRKAMIDWERPDRNLTIKDQAELLSLNRTGLYRP